MKKKSRTLGWLGAAAAAWWLYYDYQGQLRKAVLAGWATLALIAAHIATARR